jgi:hypothetical protein
VTADALLAAAALGNLLGVQFGTADLFVDQVVGPGHADGQEASAGCPHGLEGGLTGEKVELWPAVGDGMRRRWRIVWWRPNRPCLAKTSDAPYAENMGSSTPPGQIDDSLTEVPRAGGRQLLEQAVEAELEAFRAVYADPETEDGRQRLVRHGDAPSATC